MRNHKLTKVFRGAAGKAILINAVFVLYFCHYHFAVNRFIFSIVLSSLVYILPGWAWFLCLKKKPRDVVASLVYVVSLSFLIYLVGLIAFRIAGIGVTSENLFSYIFLVSNASFFVRRKRFAGEMPLFPVGRNLLVLALFFVLVHGYFYWGASTVVPYIKDQDYPSVNPVYGLMNYLKPYALESHFTYMLTKPPLAQFFCGYGVTLSGRLEDAKFFYDNAFKAEGTIEREDRDRWNYIKPLRIEEEKTFRKRRPELLIYTRLSYLFPAVATVLIIYHLLMTLTRVRLLAFFGTVLYLSIPEVFVRSSYAGWFAPTTFFAVMVAYLFLCFSEEERKEKGLRFSLFLASALLALTNHKGLIIIPGLLGYLFLKSVIENRGGGCLKAISVWMRSSRRSRMVLGAFAGSAIFWIYACSIDYENFYKDHIRYDFIEHFHKEGLRITSEEGRYLNRYPTLPEVWTEFNRNTGTLFLPLSFVSLVYLARRIRRREALLFFWFLVGAVGYSIVDWKQTKHLMLIILPLLLPVVLFIHDRGKTGRIILLSVVAFIVIINILILCNLNRDFSYITSTPEW